MANLRILALAACVGLPGAVAACDASSPAMDILAWDVAPDAAGTDVGRDLHGGPDTGRDVQPWDPGFDAWPSDVPGDPFDAAPDVWPEDTPGLDAPDEGRPDSTVTDTPVDTPLVDLPKDAPTDAPADAQPDAAPGTLSCPQILECARSCQYQFACVQDCVDQGSPEARQVAQALLQCAMANCQGSMGSESALQACVIQYCPDEGQACLGQCQPSCAGKECGGDGCGGDCGTCGVQLVCDNGTCVTGQALTCSGILECVTACPTSDFGCIQDCQNRGTTNAREIFGTLFDCILQNCAGSTQDPEQLAACVLAQCPGEYDACVQD
jgi:hypothetical protein